MAQSKHFTIKDFLLLSILRHAGCETSIRSFQELENDPKALKVYQSKKTIRRRVYRYWCRDPEGKTITEDNGCFGKMTPNEIQLWDATLWDFYFTNRTSSIPNLRTISTGSKLLKWMIKQGETDHAIDEMASAANEEDPREIPPFPISEVIEAQEMNIRLFSMSLIPRHVKGVFCPESDPAPWLLLPFSYEAAPLEHTTPRQVKGVFCPESYPAPWPLLPFSYEATPLEHYIPLYQLPSKIVVHDPWDLLSVTERADEESECANEDSNKEYDWASSEDRTYLYKPRVSEKGEERNEEESKAEKEEKVRRRLKALEDLHIDDPDILSDNLDAMLLVPSSVKPGPSEPPILALYEAAPDPKPAEIAHLYLSSLLALDGADGSMKDEKWKAKSGVWQKHQVSRPAEVVTSDQLDPLASFVFCSGSLKTKYKYVGPCRPIRTNVKWQNGENYCAHTSKRLHIDEGTRAHPLTVKVSVVAKLSKEGDDHLAHESDIYEEFPRHFFEHWNGYNVVVPLLNPTPVGAVVPQYYGYYEPQEDASRDQYLSPIMLLEKCGRQVVVDDLNMDDRTECASLFFRLHHEGYLHESVHPRNVLCQEGPLDRPMYQRGTGDFTEDGRKHTFRLIDFGRMQEYNSPNQRSHEEMAVGLMTKHTVYDV
ncbi:hypothetical protein JOM56_007858 [Amanita muscaria]